MRITVDLAGMPPPVQVAVQRLLDALTAVWPLPVETQTAMDETGRPTPPTSFPRPKKGTVSYVRPRILELLRQHPEGLTSRQIREQLDLGKRATSTLHGMLKAGFIARPRAGLYTNVKE